MAAGEREPCEACARPMSASAARCPHCGAMQARAAGTSAGAAKSVARPLTNVTKEEARALLAVQAASDGTAGALGPEEPGLFGGLILPHPRSAGLAWIAEVVLTVIAVPLLACSTIAAAFAWRAIARARGGVGATPRLVALFSGTPVLYGMLLFVDWSDLARGALVATCWIALMLRGVVRMLVAG